MARGLGALRPVLLEDDPRVLGEADVGVGAFDTVALFDRDWQAAEKLCFAGFVCHFGMGSIRSLGRSVSLPSSSMTQFGMCLSQTRWLYGRG